MALETTSTITAARQDDLVDALCEIVVTLVAGERQLGAPTPRLDRAVTRWSQQVGEPGDVLALVSEVRARTQRVRTRRHTEILDRVELVGVTAVARRQVQEALTDSLTGLATRARLEEEVQHLIAASVRERAPLTAVMLDLDGLKKINDERGHAAGDEAIAEAGRAIRSHLRRADRAFRFGGDEFALFLPGTSLEGARVLVERIQRSCSTPLSAGVAAHGGWAFDTDVADWLSRADADLYERRNSRRAPVAPARVGGRLAASAGLLVAALALSGAGLVGVPAALQTFDHHDAPATHAPTQAAPAPQQGTPDVITDTPAVTPSTAPAPAVVAAPASVRPVVVVVRANAPTPQTVQQASRPLPAALPPVAMPVTVPPVADAPVPTPEPPGLLTGLLQGVGGLLKALL
jgi:diguanylate cyclase (GGDEF)-like protein